MEFLWDEPDVQKVMRHILVYVNFQGKFYDAR